jgi:hypothetical protein
MNILVDDNFSVLSSTNLPNYPPQEPLFYVPPIPEITKVRELRTQKKAPTAGYDMRTLRKQVEFLQSVRSLLYYSILPVSVLRSNRHVCLFCGVVRKLRTAPRSKQCCTNRMKSCGITFKSCCNVIRPMQPS